MKKQSKIELLRQAKKQRYRVDCPLVEGDSAICAECDFFGFCAHDGFLHKKKVDDYIKRYSRKKPTTDTFSDLAEIDNSEAPDDLKWVNETKEDVNETDCVNMPKTEAVASYDRETLKSKVMKILSPVAIIAVEEYDRLKKIEKKYNEAKKFFGKWDGEL